jgi:hypothetical protein
MSEGQITNIVIPHLGWKTLLGIVLIVVTVVTSAVFYFVLPRLFGAGMMQFGLVLGFVIGSTLTTIGLHSSGKIGKEAFDRTTLALAVSAIVFATWQFRDSRVQEAGMESLSKQMSTRFIGMFPKNLEAINEIMANADRSVDIMSDFAGYGHYSSPKEFDKYLRKLEDLRSQEQPLPIRLLIYTRKQGSRVHDSQFTEELFKRALSEKDPRLISFCKRFNGGQIPSSKQEFDSLLFRKQRDYIKDLKDRGVEIRVTETELPFFLWDEDDEEAVFSFLNEDLPGAAEVSFRTRDANLIVGTFKVRFCKRWNEADDVEITEDGWQAKPSEQKGQDTVCKVR